LPETSNLIHFLMVGVMSLKPCPVANKLTDKSPSPLKIKLRDALTGKWLLTASGEKAGRLKEAKARQKAEARVQWLEQRLRELEAKS
jgi:hypothetical protein